MSRKALKSSPLLDLGIKLIKAALKPNHTYWEHLDSSTRVCIANLMNGQQAWKKFKLKKIIPDALF